MTQISQCRACGTLFHSDRIDRPSFLCSCGEMVNTGFGKPTPDEGIGPERDEVRSALNGIAPWASFLSVMGLIGAVVLVFGCLRPSARIVARGGTGALVFTLVPFMTAAGLLICLSIDALRLSSRARAYDRSGDPADLRDALYRQRGCWRTLGGGVILMMAYFVTYVILCVGVRH